MERSDTEKYENEENLYINLGDSQKKQKNRQNEFTSISIQGF